MQFVGQFINAFVAQPPFSRNGNFLLSATVCTYVHAYIHAICKCSNTHIVYTYTYVVPMHIQYLYVHTYIRTYLHCVPCTVCQCANINMVYVRMCYIRMYVRTQYTYVRMYLFAYMCHALYVVMCKHTLAFTTMPKVDLVYVFRLRQCLQQYLNNVSIDHLHCMFHMCTYVHSVCVMSV